jgi:hypothetical protein
MGDLGRPDVFIVQAADALPPDVLKQWVKDDQDVEHLEIDKRTALVEQSSRLTLPYIPSLPATYFVTDGNLTKLYGTRAWPGYVRPPAMYSTNAPTTTQRNFIGTGIVVAIIDTGVDATNPLTGFIGGFLQELNRCSSRHSHSFGQGSHRGRRSPK